MATSFSELFARVTGSVLGQRGTVDAATRRGIADHVRSLTGAAGAAGAVPDPARSLVDKIALQAHDITDDDVAAVAEHYSEDEIFEIMVTAAVAAGAARLDIVEHLLEAPDAT